MNSPSSVQSEREAFEAWGNETFNYGFRAETWNEISNEYSHEGTQMAFEGWKAGRGSSNKSTAYRRLTNKQILSICKMYEVWADHDIELIYLADSILLGASRQSEDTQSNDEFKNFHRLLCERFGYAHDEKDWRRDQISLIEWIADRAAASAQATEQTEIIRALQKALFYWMPRCAGEDSPWGTKAAEHAYLLIGLDDNSTECWGDQILQYVGIMNCQQERLEIVLRDAGCEDEADHIEFIQKLADRAAASDHADFEWPPLPAFPKPFLDSEKSGAVFTEHQMQAYANAYGEAVRRLATPPSPDAREAGGGVTLTDEQRQSMEFAIALLEGRGYTGRAKDLRALLREAGSGK